MTKSTLDPVGSKRAMPMSPIKDNATSPITDRTAKGFGGSGAASVADPSMSQIKETATAPLADKVAAGISDTGGTSADDPLMSQLRQLYDSVADEPIPEPLQVLLQRFRN